MSIKINKNKNKILIPIFLTCLILTSWPVHADEITSKILERWTSFHWGDNNFIWVVHYPSEIVDAWVNSEAKKSNMNDVQRANYKKNFIEDLQINKSEAFLISVYSFGKNVPDLRPINENFKLINSSGEKISPLKYDSNLEYLAPGVVQGLIFFPKQPDKNFALSINKIAPEEKIFSFAPPEIIAPKQIPENKPAPNPEVIVVNLPKKTPPPPKFEHKPIAPPVKIEPVQEDNSMKDFVNDVLAKRAKSKEPEDDQNKNNNNNVQLAVSRPVNVDDAYISREHLLRRFLLLWSDNNPSEMYEMLNEQSKKNISRENFIKEIYKTGDFRAGLKTDYKIDWIGEERAKITVTRKNLMFKNLSARTLGVTREGSSWKIVW